jgi:acyl-CoA reductase-like NAD-dependent aldehyde dehydrogenase
VLIFSVYNPTTGEVLVKIPEGLAADVEVALDAAHNAFNTTWGLNIPGFERGKLLMKIATLMERDIDILKPLLSSDTTVDGPTRSTVRPSRPARTSLPLPDTSPLVSVVRSFPGTSSVPVA